MTWIYAGASFFAAFVLVFVWALCAAARRGDEMQSRIDQWPR